MKRLTAIFLALALCLTLAACGGNANSGGNSNNSGGNADGGSQGQTGAPPADGGGSSAQNDQADVVPTRIGSLKGPTSIGLAKLRSEEEAEEFPAYQFTLETDASALLAGFVSKELDIALIPANAAAIWYNKLEGDVVCLDVNTLGVLYIVGADSSVASIEDLAGRTVYLPGQGTSPDYVLQYLLSQHGMSLDNVTVEYKSEAAEVIASLAANPEAVGVLPQPSVTAALGKLEGDKVLMDLTEEWGKVCDTDLITGVTVMRREFLEHVAFPPEEVDAFLEAHAESTAFVSEDVAAAAALVEQYGVMDNAKVAEKAIPSCNVTCITGQEMKDMVSAYLQVLYDLDPASVGGQLPADDFYYLG